MITRTRVLLLAALAAAVACSEDITGGARQVGGPAIDFGLTPANARGITGGASTIRNYEITSISSTLGPDAFNRSGTSGARIGYGTPACPGLGGTLCWNFSAWLRDSAGDPRLPAMKRLPGPLNTNFCVVGGPEYFGGQNVRAYELFCRFFAVAGQPYYLSLVRYGLVVRGDLDAVERLVYGRVTQPDSLVVLGESPGGDPAINYEWISNAGCNSNLTVNGANPLNLGSAAGRSPDGRVTFDKCFASQGTTGKIFYFRTTAVVPDSAPWFRNSLVPPVISQQYNYIVVSEGSAPGGRIVARAQVGADIDPATGNAIPNSFAPFPGAALSPGDLISKLKVAEGGPSGVRMTVLPLDSLAGSATYRIVLVSRETGEAQQVNAAYRRIRRDTIGRDDVGNPIVTVDTSPVVVTNAFSGGASNVTHLIEVHDSLSGGPKIRDFDYLALQPPAAVGAVPIWAQYLDRRGTAANTQDDLFVDNGVVTMGILPLAVNPVPVIFTARGSATGTNRGDQIGIAFQNLSRPPAGFRYHVWLMPADSTQAPVSLGGLRTPLPDLASLDDADVAAIGGVLTRTTILRSNVLIRPADLRAMGIDLARYNLVRVTLEAKDGGPGMSPMVVLEGPFPTVVP